MAEPLPQMLQALPEGVNGEDVDEADEVALLGPVDDVQGVLQVGQQASVLGPEVRARAFRKTTTTNRGPSRFFCCPQEVCFRGGFT